MKNTTTRMLVDDAVRALNNLVCHVVHHDRLSPLGDKLLAVGLTASQWDSIIEADYFINSVQDDMPSEDAKLPLPPPDVHRPSVVYNSNNDRWYLWHGAQVIASTQSEGSALIHHHTYINNPHIKRRLLNGY